MVLHIQTNSWAHTRKHTNTRTIKIYASHGYLFDKSLAPVSENECEAITMIELDLHTMLFNLPFYQQGTEGY